VTTENPIGVFDSGVGGLSVLREIRNELPHEDLLYVADSGYAPYGDRSQELIQSRAAAVVQFLVNQQAKAVVVACNTATGIAIDTLRTRFSIPLVAIEPAVKPAATMTRSGVVGILATTQTLSSPKFSRLLAGYSDKVRFLVQACPGLVEQVEKGELSSRATRALVEQYVLPLLEQGADTLVLGCTHYPFLDGVIKSVAGPAVTLIDPAVAVARELRRRLQTDDLLSRNNRTGTNRFWTSGTPHEVKAVIDLLWMDDVDVQSMPSAFCVETP
jgi:glutamate racemase